MLRDTMDEASVAQEHDHAGAPEESHQRHQYGMRCHDTKIQTGRPRPSDREMQARYVSFLQHVPTVPHTSSSLWARQLP